MQKKVSVIIPYYKNIKYIFKSVQSVLRQKYKNIEIILIYDDENQSDLEQLLKRYSKIKNFIFIINKQNLGVAISRNKGLKIVKGYYTAFLDSDDYWKINKLNSQIKFMEKHSLDFSYTAYDTLKENNKYKKDIKTKYNYDELIKKCDIGLSTVIIKSKMIKKGMFPDIKTQEDYALWLRYFRSGAKVMGINKSLSVWRNTPNSLSSNYFQKIRDAFKVYHKYEKKNVLESVFSVMLLSFNKIKNILYFK